MMFLGGISCQLVPDIEEFDQYGRMLSYVYFNDLLINAEMARRGTALTRSYPPNTTLQPHLTAAREYAEAGRLGLWGACTSDGDPNVVILSIQADAPGRDNENLNGEFIIIKNQTDSDIDLSSWTIRDESSVHRYVFDINSVIATGDFIVVHTGCGANAYDKHYWCNSSPVWDNSGDTAFLVDAAGNIHDRFGY